jgi:hypothetical protein
MLSGFNSLICEAIAAAMDCPSMPDVSQINRDVRVDIQGSAASLGKVKAGELETKTEVIAKNLFEKYPNIDRLVTVQMMSATYCSLLRDSASLSEKERQERWEKFQERVFSFVGSEPVKTSPKSPSRREPVKKPDKTSSKGANKASESAQTKASRSEGGPATRQSERQVSKDSTTAPAANTKPPTPLSPEKPQQASPPPVNNAQIANAPPNIIPQDPIKASAAFTSMRANIKDAIQNKDTITFLMSHPKDDNQDVLILVSNILGEACRETPRQCWFTQQSSPRDLDRPPLEAFRTKKGGIIVHGPDANKLANALGAWFETYSTSNLPAELGGYKIKETEHLIWIDIGPGSPWKSKTP